jgi:glycyl-tRNA synthetase beta chain
VSRDLLFEIGVEEMPAGYVSSEGGESGAASQLRRDLARGLAATRLPFRADDAETFATPRRLAVVLRGVPDREDDFEEIVQGPSARAAFDAEGRPTRALLGFCQGKGVEVSAVRRVQTPKGEYVEVTVHRRGRSSSEVLAELLASIATRLTFPKTMRWLDDDTRFARPVRWLVALLDDEVVPVKAFGLEAGRRSFGHRFLAPGPRARHPRAARPRRGGRRGARRRR